MQRIYLLVSNTAIIYNFVFIQFQSLTRSLAFQFR